MPSEAFTRVFCDIIAEISPAPAVRESSGGVCMSGARVAVVIEDEPDIRSLLADILEEAGFEVHTAGSGLDGIELVRSVEPIITTLDVSMPGMDGFETAKRIRAFSSTYILMLTARSEEIDALQGLQSGADDYVVKPFRPRELRARVEAMMRRPRTMPEVPSPESARSAEPGTVAGPDPVSTEREHDSGWLEHRGLRAHPDMRLVTADGETVDLTRTEFDIVVELLDAGRRVLSKADLAQVLRGERGMPTDFITEHDMRAIEVHVGNLRRKLGESSARPRWIETVRGVGYRLTA